MALLKVSSCKLIKPIEILVIKANSMSLLFFVILNNAVTKEDSAFLVKLFYQKDSNSLAALLEYLRLKIIQNLPMQKKCLK